MSDIVTLRMDAGSQAHFEEMRRTHYPAELNRIGAHLTLFHTLPEEPWVREALQHEAELCGGFRMEVTGLRSLGRGVAYVVQTPELLRVHGRLSAEFREVLTAQDRQGFRPHVVVQNKASAETARELLRTMQEQFKPFVVEATGLELWHYRGGPWEFAQGFAFSG